MEDLPITHAPTTMGGHKPDCFSHWGTCPYGESCYYSDSCNERQREEAYAGVDFGGPDQTAVHLSDPEGKMTQEQKDFFIWMAQLGVCCGLETPLEWLLNYQMHQGNLEVYTDIPAKLQLSWETMFAFYRNTGPEFEEMTLEQFQSWVDLQIETRRKYAIETHET